MQQGRNLARRQDGAEDRHQLAGMRRSWYKNFAATRSIHHSPSPIFQSPLGSPPHAFPHLSRAFTGLVHHRCVRFPSLNPRKLITTCAGTSSGFGKQLVTSVLARGDRVIATARNIEKIKHFQSLPDASSRLALLRLDVSDSAENIQRIVEYAISIWGRIDVVVNNAGLGMKSVLEEGGYVWPHVAF